MFTCQSFRPVAPFFFLAKVQFLAFLFNTERVWPYKDAYDVPLVTLILNIYGSSSILFSFKSTFFCFFFLYAKDVSV